MFTDLHICEAAKMGKKNAFTHSHLYGLLDVLLVAQPRKLKFF